MSITLLTATEIADILRISKSLAYRLITNGEIPSIQFGRVSRVRQEDLEAFIQRSMRKSGSKEVTESDPNFGVQAKGDVDWAI
jgi:excisionase family DNA binding protein